MKFFKKQQPKVLVVDDDKATRSLVAAILRDEGFGEVLEAASGEAALSIAYSQRPQLVVLDYRMPGLLGDHVARALRVITPDARIVAFSAVLDAKPDWADAFVDKTEIEDLVPFLRDQSKLTSRL